MSSNYYYSGQGSLLAAQRDAVTGRPLGFSRVGNVPELTLNIETSKYEHKEAESGSRLTDLVLIKEKKGTFEFTLENLDLDGLAMGFWGEKATVAGATISGPQPETVYLGKFVEGAVYALEHPKVSLVVVKDSAGTDTYDEGVDYLVDYANGTIRPLVGGAIATAQAALVGLTARIALKVTYTYGGYVRMDAFTQPAAPERWLRFQGINTVDGSAVIVDLFRAAFDPMTAYGLINEELGSVKVAGTLLADSMRVTGSKFFTQRNVGV